MKNPEEALKKYFGFDNFRPGQDKIVECVASGRDAMVIMPTGGGKSLCYQLPALLVDGVTVVISPLIALMKDQVDALSAKGIAATVINSTLNPSEQWQRISELAAGEYKLVYIAPERFRDQRFIEALSRVKIAFFAVDEAHCVSMWGHDFRPDYMKVGEAVRRLGRPSVAAFTATATPDVRADIIKNLDLRDQETFVSGFERPNLEFRISRADKDAEKYARLTKIIETHKTGIVYCATRKRVEEVAERLGEWDISHIAYHGGMDDVQRNEVQEIFINKQADVAVATNAFGMGIDRSDIRFVAHFEIPGSVEAYYQEAGRAGRDGLPAICELLYGHNDLRIQEFFIEGSNPSITLIKDVYRLLQQCADENNEVKLSIAEITDAMGEKTNGMAVSTAINILSRTDCIQRFDIPKSRIRGTRIVDPQLSAYSLPIDVQALNEKQRRDKAKLDAMISYGKAFECRQEHILHYFGEEETHPCGRCDQCQLQAPEGMREPNTEEVLVLKKALSGIARMSYRGGPEKWSPRFGKNRIIEMLVGSQNAEMIKHRLNELTTYGLLKNEGTHYLQHLFDEFLRTGLVRTTGGRYPMITLTPLGEAVMKDQATVKLVWPKSDKPEDDSDFDQDLFNALREKRTKMATDRGVRFYQIFPDKTLKHLAIQKPITKEEALEVSGIGKFKATRILPPFLKIIAEHVGRQ